MWKDIEPFVGLLFTSALLAHANQRTKKQARAQNKEENKKRLQMCIGVLAALVVFAAALVGFSVPAALQGTHPDVARQKAEARAACRSALEAYDFAAAERAIRGNALSKQLYASYRTNHSGTIAHQITPLFNYLAFRTGSLCAVLPLLGLLALHLIGQRGGPGASWSAKMGLGGLAPAEREWSLVLLPALHLAVTYGWVVNLAFHFWLRERQVTACMLLSGH